MTIWVLAGELDAAQKADLIEAVARALVAAGVDPTRGGPWVLIEEIGRGGGAADGSAEVAGDG